MQLSPLRRSVLPAHVPGATHASVPRYVVLGGGAISRGLWNASAPSAAASSRAGALSGYRFTHASPALACASVAFVAGERSKPEKMSGGGGNSDVSGTTDSQSC